MSRLGSPKAEVKSFGVLAEMSIFKNGFGLSVEDRLAPTETNQTPPFAAAASLLATATHNPHDYARIERNSVSVSRSRRCSSSSGVVSDGLMRESYRPLVGWCQGLYQRGARGADPLR